MEMEELAVESSVLASASSMCDSFGDPEITARVGDEYQAVIPTVITESNEMVSWNDSHHSFNVGLPLLLTRIKDEAELPTDFADVSEKNVSKKYRRVKKQRIFPEDEATAKIESLDTKVEDGLDMKEYTKLSMQEKAKNEMNQKHGGDGYYIVPGLSTRSWSDLEEASFLLGLYTFGKNLVLVQKFVESKTIGDVLSYYYGKFYRNVQYRRWVDGRKKKRRRKCVCGHKIFTGSRQQEMLARLHMHVSEDCRSTLSEVSQKFGEGKLSLEDYVFVLKSTVGLNALVDAVGIGTGKKDLTNRNVELPAAPVLQEIPTGKFCSSLSPSEIINVLTGGSRLSKVRSNDLFWEAVWPRLLARGWHSEQPNDYSFAAASNSSLVFLVPGIKKFSRSKLVKGNHYFDSIAEVLKKVVSDPTQLVGGRGWVDTSDHVEAGAVEKGSSVRIKTKTGAKGLREPQRLPKIVLKSARPIMTDPPAESEVQAVEEPALSIEGAVEPVGPSGGSKRKRSETTSQKPNKKSRRGRAMEVEPEPEEELSVESVPAPSVGDERVANPRDEGPATIELLRRIDQSRSLESSQPIIEGLGVEHERELVDRAIAEHGEAGPSAPSARVGQFDQSDPEARVDWCGVVDQFTSRGDLMKLLEQGRDGLLEAIVADSLILAMKGRALLLEARRQEEASKELEEARGRMAQMEGFIKQQEADLGELQREVALVEGREQRANELKRKAEERAQKADEEVKSAYDLLEVAQVGQREAHRQRDEARAERDDLAAEKANWISEREGLVSELAEVKRKLESFEQQGVVGRERKAELDRVREESWHNCLQQVRFKHGGISVRDLRSDRIVVGGNLVLPRPGLVPDECDRDYPTDPSDEEA